MFWLAVIALTLVYGAYVPEVYRAGIESIHWSQTAARGRSVSPTRETMRFVVVPQAVRRIIPPLLNDFIGLQKDTALVGFVGRARRVQPRPHRRVEPASTSRPSPVWRSPTSSSRSRSRSSSTTS